MLIAVYVGIPILFFGLPSSSLQMKVTSRDPLHCRMSCNYYCYFTVLTILYYITYTVGARTALNLSGTMLGFYPLRVLPSKTAIAPVNPTYLPRVMFLCLLHVLQKDWLERPNNFYHFCSAFLTVLYFSFSV